MRVMSDGIDVNDAWLQYELVTFLVGDFSSGRNFVTRFAKLLESSLRVTVVVEVLEDRASARICLGKMANKGGNEVNKSK